jgi:hypothetical protein
LDREFSVSQLDAAQTNEQTDERNLLSRVPQGRRHHDHDHHHHHNNTSPPSPLSHALAKIQPIMEIKVTLPDIVSVARARFPAAFKQLTKVETFGNVVYITNPHFIGLVIGRIVINLNNERKACRHVLANLSPDGGHVGVGFINKGVFVAIENWTDVGIQYCTPFALMNASDKNFKARVDTFVKYCHLAGRKREFVMVGLEYMMDLREIMEDIGWTWQVWKEDGGKDVKGFMQATTKADEDMLAKYHQQQQGGRSVMESESSMEVENEGSPKLRTSRKRKSNGDVIENDINSMESTSTLNADVYDNSSEAGVDEMSTALEKMDTGDDEGELM